MKNRRILKRDLETVKDFVKKELENRKRLKFRTAAETIWKKVDAQVAMEAPPVVMRDGKGEGDWHNEIQLGDLADASEVLSADILRILFPNDRAWMRPHIDTEKDLPEALTELVPENGDRRTGQRIMDGVVRSFMAQQHADFGLRDRVRLSVKEALHHGSFVAEARWETMTKFHHGSDVEQLGAPVWVPHSMWNCYPDSSASVIGTDLFYRGSMIIESHMPHEKFVRIKEWNNKKEVEKPQDGSDLKILTYYGDITIDRSEKPIFLPNRKVVIAGDVLVFTKVNSTPYIPIIYTGYERDDVRNPYYTSPLIKRSPMHALATQLANKYLDAVDLRNEPPVVYDSLDPQFAQDGGPPIYPGAKIPSKGTASFKVIETADPGFALQGLTMAKQHVAEGTGTDSIRKGVSPGTEQTATEIVKIDQKSEIRTVAFIGTLERQALLPFLYMQHDLNSQELKSYPFYNDEMHTADFMWASKKALPKDVRFEITGSRSLLGEEQRTNRFQKMAVFVLSNPELASKTDVGEILRQAWEDSGVKDPERFLIVEKEEANPEQQVAQVTQQAEQAIQQVQQQAQELGKAEGEKRKSLQEKHNAELAKNASALEAQQAINVSLREQLKITNETRQAQDQIRSTAKQHEVKDGNRVNEIEGATKELVATVDKMVDISIDRDRRREERLQGIFAVIEKNDPEFAAEVSAEVPGL